MAGRVPGRARRRVERAGGEDGPVAGASADERGADEMSGGLPEHGLTAQILREVPPHWEPTAHD
ncbi:hypothetical protein [Rarobacter incanus]|uniref:Uncharacterized protein n=1 Tax=Rarobacter incanus TaxID=153494 RepID=A0A542SNX8_9MICO|nr:hypothetical protein [Rarobacter incanus]TQK76313.1 hypothetical protein FB389_0979 [Rarobacter incanus]